MKEISSITKKLSKWFLGAGLAASALAGGTNTAHAIDLDCEVADVAEFVGARIHVRCNNTVVINGQTIRYIAVPVTDAARANRFMQLGSTALLSGKRLRGSLPTASTTNAPGCGASDCRTPDAFVLF